MRRYHSRRIAGAAGLCAGIALCCSCSLSAPTEFLTLQPVAPDALSAPIRADPIRVIAVHVPPWLDRLEVARPTGGDSIAVEEFERWSAPVGDLALTALTKDLADRLTGVLVLPARAAAPPATRDVSVDLVSLVPHGGSIELDATATVTDARSGALILSLPFHLQGFASPTDAADEALVLDRFIGQLADRLAARLS